MSPIANSGSSNGNYDSNGNTPADVALAASSAMVVAKALLHPIDTLKCRVQILPKNSKGLWKQYEGKWGPRYIYGGLHVKLLFYIPYEAVYMTAYHSTQQYLGNTSVWHTPAAAVAAEFASCALRVPVETAKMRIQSTVTRGTLNTLRQMQQGGLRACARLILPQTLLHDIPYSVVQWVTYEYFKPRFGVMADTDADAAAEHARGVWSRYHTQLVHSFFSGGFAGLAAAVVTVPLDNIRTRVLVATAADPSAGVASVVRAVYQQGGLRGFVRGGALRVVWVTANMAVYFPIYEGLKVILRERHTVTSGHSA